MAPKKKRGGQPQVSLPVAKSTRATKRSIAAAAAQKSPPMKPVKARARRGARGRGRKAAVKVTTKSEVKSDDPPQTQSDTSQGEIINLVDDDDEESPHTTEPIEQIFLKMEEMETGEVENNESEACEIAQQLEDLNVGESQESRVQGEEEKVDEVVAVVEDVEQEEVLIENCEEEFVEYISDEFVPVAGDTEIIIEGEGVRIEEKAEVEIEDETKAVANVATQEDAEEVSIENSSIYKVKEDLESELEAMFESESKPEEEIKKAEPKEETQEAESKTEELLKVEPETKKKAKKDTKKVAAAKKNVKPKPKKEPNNKTEEVRRSSRIKSITVSKQRVSEVKHQPKPPEIENPEIITTEKLEPPLVPEDNKPVKVKSRWRRSSELEMNVLTPASVVMETCGDSEKIEEVNTIPEDEIVNNNKEIESRLKQFVHLKENLYLTERMACKEAKKMTCDCFLTPEDIDRGELGCGDDCLNRLLMIECGVLCPLNEKCTNKRFQKSLYAPVEVFKTKNKGLGLRAAANIPYGEFILEYVGEVLDPDEFDSRADGYSNDKNQHYYFMSLRSDAIIDATRKGNISRFINHSCDPNAETQKWTVNGELRIGFFSTRMILAGEEITFDYRFQRYGKEAQRCYCEASICRGWLGEEPDDDEDEEDEEEEEAEEQTKEKTEKEEESVEKTEDQTEKIEQETVETPKVKKVKEKKKSPRIKPRKDIFDDLDLDEEIEMLVTTGLKNQAHTLKLSRLIVRAKEPAQRAKLLRVLRRGELPCRRLFLDYHGLRLIHGYMTDAQDLAKKERKFESLRLELLQTLATLPIPNKTMLQDSKVLSTVEKWSSGKSAADLDSDSSSPQDNQTEEKVFKQEADQKVAVKSEAEVPETAELKSEDRNYEEEITALALKLLEEWSNLKEVFKIPKKERLEQMKEHEREANRTYIAGLGLEQDSDRKVESRYRILKRYRSLEKNDAISSARKNIKLEDRTIANFPKLGKFERRRMFALQVEQREEERKRKQREIWRQHEQHCILLGTDPRLTAPFDPNRGYQCIWNPQIGQWQNYPLQGAANLVFNQNQLNQPPNYPYIHGGGMIPGVPPGVPPMQTLPPLPYQEELKKEEDCSQVKFMGPIPPPVKLPPKWKCAKDKYGRPYYYHIKIRKSQWEPPPLSQPQVQEEAEESSESSSSSDTSSLSSTSSSEESESDDDVDDSRLIMEVRKQMERQQKIATSKAAPSASKEIKETKEVEKETSPVVEEEKEEKMEVVDEENDQDDIKEEPEEQEEGARKKARSSLVQEIIISPRAEGDRLQFKEDLKRYRMNKEKLKREKEMIMQQTKKHAKEKKHKTIIKLKMKEMNDSNSESAKRIKETFRSSMATVVVGVLNAYRKPDCKEGRITNTEDFKHLARKLTHFVMLKEMKHIEKIEDLVCTDSVKAKAREYIRKYMGKFGENYQKRNDEPDY